MELLKYLPELTFLISAIVVLTILFRFSIIHKLPVMKAFLINIVLFNILFILVIIWEFLTKQNIATDNSGIFSLKFIFDTVTYFIEISVPISLFVFIQLIFNRTLPKFNYRILMIPIFLLVTPKIAAWIERSIYGSSYILQNLYFMADIFLISSIIACCIYLRYRASIIPNIKFGKSLNLLSVIYLVPFLLAFFQIILFQNRDIIPEYLNSIINTALLIFFNIGLAFWVSNYNLLLAGHFGKKEVEPSLDLENFRSEYGITNRELDVIKLICEGKTNNEIAEVLFISPKTVKDHNYNIFKKTAVKNRLQLANLYRSL